MIAERRVREENGRSKGERVIVERRVREERLIDRRNRKRKRKQRWRCIIDGSCYKYKFFRDKLFPFFFSESFVATKALSRQNYACRDKSFFATICFCLFFVRFFSSILLSRQKRYLWQLSPVIKVGGRAKERMSDRWIRSRTHTGRRTDKCIHRKRERERECLTSERGVSE